MKVFNLAEELEKERKKNKELTNKLHISWESQEQLEYRIDSAIKLIEQYDSMTAIVKKPDEEGIFVFDGNFGIKEDLLNILKGSDNNDK